MKINFFYKQYFNCFKLIFELLFAFLLVLWLRIKQNLHI